MTEKYAANTFEDKKWESFGDITEAFQSLQSDVGQNNSTDAFDTQTIDQLDKPAAKRALDDIGNISITELNKKYPWDIGKNKLQTYLRNLCVIAEVNYMQYLNQHPTIKTYLWNLINPTQPEKIEISKLQAEGVLKSRGTYTEAQLINKYPWREGAQMLINDLKRLCTAAERDYNTYLTEHPNIQQYITKTLINGRTQAERATDKTRNQ